MIDESKGTIFNTSSSMCLAHHCLQFSIFLGICREKYWPFLTLKLAGYFAKHIQARGGGGGGFVEPPPKNFEMANN